MRHIAEWAAPMPGGSARSGCLYARSVTTSSTPATARPWPTARIRRRRATGYANWRRRGGSGPRVAEYTLLHGDCLTEMAAMDAGSVDAVVTDPPYMIGAASVGKPNSKAGTWADMMNSAYWYSAWINASRRVCKPDAWLAIFGNWRSLPTYMR